MTRSTRYEGYKTIFNTQNSASDYSSDDLIPLSKLQAKLRRNEFERQFIQNQSQMDNNSLTSEVHTSKVTDAQIKSDTGTTVSENSDSMVNMSIMAEEANVSSDDNAMSVNLIVSEPKEYMVDTTK